MKAKTVLIFLIGLFLLIPLSDITSQATVDVVCFDGDFVRGTRETTTELRTFPEISGLAAVKFKAAGFHYRQPDLRSLATVNDRYGGGLF